MPALIVDNESTLTPDHSPAMVVDESEEFSRAVRIPYKPSNAGDWTDPDPTNVREALDTLSSDVLLIFALFLGSLQTFPLVNMVDVQSA